MQPVELASRGFQRVEGITPASSNRGWQLSAGHRVNVPAIPVATWGAFTFALSLSLLRWAGPAEEPMTQIMREIVKVADTCTSGCGDARQVQPHAPHARAPLVGCIGLALAVPYVSAAQALHATPDPVVGYVSYDRAREKLVAQPTKYKPRALVLVYAAICDRDTWRHAEAKADTTSGVRRNFAWSREKCKPLVA